MVRLKPERQAAQKPTQRTKDEQPPVDGTLPQENEVETEQDPAEERVEVVAVPEKEQKEDEATVALKKQIEALKKSETYKNEQLARLQQQQAEWVRQQQELLRQQRDFEQQSQEQEEVAVGAALAAAKAEADKAQSDISRAMEAQDWSAFADAQRRLARAEANASRLETGKEELEARKKTPKQEQQQEQRYIAPGSDEQIQAMRLPAAESQWLRENRRYLTDQRAGAQLTEANYYARDLGFEPGHPDYLPTVEERLALLQKRRRDPEAEEREDREERQEQQRQAAIVSAPVSRDVPDGSGQRQTRRITLTNAQRDAARIAGISEQDYAKQLIKLNQLKADGEYGERR